MRWAQTHRAGETLQRDRLAPVGAGLDEPTDPPDQIGSRLRNVARPAPEAGPEAGLLGVRRHGEEDDAAPVGTA